MTKQTGIEKGHNVTDSTASLKEMMTTPPMTAEQHSRILRNRVQQRRDIEEEKNRKAMSGSDLW